jgi:carboxymethylenebutenolidase
MISVGQLINLNKGEFSAYVAEPTDAVRGGLVVIHEIWGLVDHIKDVADRLAANGYVAVAPDLLTGIGISPEVGEELLGILRSDSAAERSRFQPMLREKLAPTHSPEFAQWAVSALRRTVDYLAERPEVENRIGVIGFCFGGSYSFALAAAESRIRVAIPFYGSPPELTEVGRIASPVLAFYGDQDERLMSSLPEVSRAMAEAGVDFSSQVYTGVGHAFFNDTSPQTYDAASAADAWKRTLEMLDQSLVSSQQ